MNREQGIVAHQNRIVSRQTKLEVRIQTPEGTNLASKMGCPQVSVANPDGSVVAFCGPVNQEGLEDAALFAAAPRLYHAALLTPKHLEHPESPLFRAGVKAAENAIAHVHADFSFSEER